MHDIKETAEKNPFHAWIEPTSRCNTKCTYCEHYYSNFGEDMPRGLYHKIRKAIFPNLERAELIGYGEPLIADIFDEMFNDCVENDIEVYTTTNGLMLLKEGFLEKFAKENITICLSIDGARKETAEFARRYIPFEKTIRILEKIKEVGDEAGNEKRFSIRFNVVVMKKNIGDLPDLVRMAKKYGADQMIIFPLAAEDQLELLRGQSIMDNPELVAEPFIRAWELAVKFKIVFYVPSIFHELVLMDAKYHGGGFPWFRKLFKIVFLKIRETGLIYIPGKVRERLSFLGPLARKCVFPWESTYFASDGKVFPCCILGDHCMGDMKSQPWEEIWNGQQYRNLRRTIHSWNPPDVCRHCGLPDGINGGDDHRFCRFFEKFEETFVPLDSPELEMEEGFYPLEYHEDKPHHYWMAKQGWFRIRKRKNAKFLRLKISPVALGDLPNPGICRINNIHEHPFDDSCHRLHFPVKMIKKQCLDISLTMENVYHPKNDERNLSLPITGISWLS
mgnify:FL=1